ncbi:SIMPL domain-containing protein [Roseococcus sp. YIM B11640]|uniref:SIMPL domain-containing protein n=1 Tax=Roseococcus sp. YIM B11640 TaxID=3133973 RepID=UPI003C7BA3F1
MRRALLAALLMAAPLPAFAQGAESRLRIAEEGSVRTMPDEMVASLRVEARAPTAAAAQDEVNRRVAAALEAARGVAGVQAATRGYSTHTDAERQQAVAQQSIELKSGQGAALLALLARLQGDGLLLDHAGWQLTPAAGRAARDGATNEAIRGVQARAAAVARELGMRVAEMRELSVDVVPEGPRPMMAMRASGPAEPNVTAEEITTTARVSAEFKLRR